MIRKAAIFRTIGVLGDSLASGEFEYDEGGVKGFWDCYEHSWGKYIARAIGSDVTVFARGGLTAHALYHDADEKKSPIADINRLFDEDNGNQAYIIALGVNDLLGVGNLENLYQGETGNAQTDICPEDYTRCRESYVGTMGKIIVRLKAITPRAKFFLVSMPDDGNPFAEKHLACMRDIAGRLEGCYVIDLYHKPPYDHAFHQAYYCGGHMNAMGYLYTADLILDEMDAIISRAPLDFTLCQFAASGKEPYAYTHRNAFLNGSKDECKYVADLRGRVINAFGGGVLYADGAYHRYGLSLRSLSAEEGGEKSGNGIAMYRSDDLYNWENEGIVLPLTGREDSPLRGPMKLDGPSILYNEKTRKYVLWCHYVRFPGDEGTGEGMNEAAVAVSNRVNGPYQFLGTVRPIDGKTPVCGLTAFKDADGNGYLILDRMEEGGRRLTVAKLSDDFLSVTAEWAPIAHGENRQTPCVTRHGSEYVLLCRNGASGPYACLRAASPMGPWVEAPAPLGDGLCSDKPAAFLTLADSQRQILLLDRYNPENLQRSAGIFLPVSFTEDGGMEIPYLETWALEN